MIRYHSQILTAVLAAALATPAHATIYFGTDGRDGRNGNSGVSGASGADRTITATGDSFEIDMSGKDGTDAQDGESGLSAQDCAQKKQGDYMQGARGGDGGFAGAAGNGGAGGDLTVYTDNYANLKRVYVNASGGRGGRGGRAGRGSEGCVCQYRSWEWITRDDQGNETRWTYSCTDGRVGEDRRDSGEGSAGSPGSLIVIKRLKPLEAVRASMYIRVGSITGQKYTLSNHVFLTKSGASGLLAAGSKIADTYAEYSHTQSWSYGFDWKVERPLSHFSDDQIFIAANNNGQGISVTLPSTVWFTQHVDNSGEYPVMIIDEAVHTSEVNAVEANAYGSGASFAIDVTDQGKVGKWVDTTASLVLTGKSGWKTKTLYSGPVTLQKTGDNTFKIAVGQLPGVDKGALAVGKKITINLSINRRMSNNSTTLTRKIEHKVTGAKK